MIYDYAMLLHTDFELERLKGLSSDELVRGTWRLEGLNNLPDTSTHNVANMEPRRIFRTPNDFTTEECLSYATTKSRHPTLRLSDFAKSVGAEIDCDDIEEMKLKVLERARRKVTKHMQRIPVEHRQAYWNRYQALFMDLCGPIRATV